MKSITSTSTSTMRDARTLEQIERDGDLLEMIDKAIFRAARFAEARLYNETIVSVILSDRYSVKETAHKNAAGDPESILVKIGGNGSYDDLVSETYIRARRNAEKHPENDGFRAIVNGAYTAIFVLIDELRGKATMGKDAKTGKRLRTGRREETIADERFDIVSCYRDTDCDYFDTLCALYDACADSLDRAIVTMRDAGYTGKEIADAHGISAAAVCKRLAKIRERFDAAAAHDAAQA